MKSQGFSSSRLQDTQLQNLPKLLLLIKIYKPSQCRDIQALKLLNSLLLLLLVVQLILKSHTNIQSCSQEKGLDEK